MNMKPLRFALCVIAVAGSLLYAGCSKDGTPATTGANTPGTPNTPAPPTGPSTQDSSVILASQWGIVKDSVDDTPNFYINDGSFSHPAAGVYYGTPADYYNFQSNGSVSIHENGQNYSSAYKLYPNNKLVITALLVYDTIKVVTLTTSNAVFDWTGSSPNGGKYYHRLYLKK